MKILKNETDIPDQVRLVMQHLISGIVKIKVGMVRGVYLTGSIPLNDYHPGKSDIDFVILCDELPNDVLQKRLEKLHKKTESKYKTNLGGSFINHEALNISNQQSNLIVSYHESKMMLRHFEMAAITLYELKTTAIRMGGTEMDSLPIQISLKDVHQFLLQNINSYWKNWCDRHSTMFNKKLALIFLPGLTEWVILGLARQLYTLHTGKICSKTEAGYYCLKHLPSKYQPVIQAAIQIRNDNKKHRLVLKQSYVINPSLKRCNETLETAYFIIDKFNKDRVLNHEVIKD